MPPRRKYPCACIASEQAQPYQPFATANFLPEGSTTRTRQAGCEDQEPDKIFKCLCGRRIRTRMMRSTGSAMKICLPSSAACLSAILEARCLWKHGKVWKHACFHAFAVCFDLKLRFRSKPRRRGSAAWICGAKAWICGAEGKFYPRAGQGAWGRW